MSLHPLLARDDDCPECGGSGEVRGGDGEGDFYGVTCPACRGDRTRGEVCDGCGACGPKRDEWGHVNSYSVVARCNGTGRIPGDASAPRVIEIEHLPGPRAGWGPTWGSGDFSAKILDVEMAFALGTTRLFGDTPEAALQAARERLK